MKISIDLVKDDERRSRSRSPMSSLVKELSKVDLGWNADKYWAWNPATGRWWIYYQEKWWTEWCRHRNDPNAYWISWADWEEKNKWKPRWVWHFESRRYWMFQWATWWTRVEKDDTVQWVNYERWDDKVKEMETLDQAKEMETSDQVEETDRSFLLAMMQNHIQKFYSDDKF